ncbi:MAG: TonB-dependent receptor [Acidobacteria bacterium]|nr:TonB-dependent receptor [Acidobacteriota bacterium]
MKNWTIRLFGFLAVALGLWGQGERGTFNGIVTDSSGSVVPGAVVTATNMATNVETLATTTDAGVYRMPYVPSGTYRISVAKPGFQTAVAENVVLHVAQTLTLDFKLQVGAVSETVTVSSEPPLLESSTAEIGRYVSKKEFDTFLNLVGDGQRQIQQFIFSSLPGTVGGTFQGSINGGQYYSHEILIEGIALGRFDLQGGSNNEFSPSADAVSEFKLQTGAMGAQYNGGQTSVANFAIKSGTNELHGTAWTYVQNDALRANSFSNNAAGRRRPPFKLFNWGYGVGGPVYIPKVYDGRNKTFWFTNFEDTRQRDFTSTAFGTLPTREFKQGDFSRLYDAAFTGRPQSGSVIGTDALGRSIRFGQIYDPLSGQQVGNSVVRDPFPGNIVPQSSWSPVSRKILELAPITDPINNNMLLNVPVLSSCCPIFDEHIVAVKGDHLFSSKHRISAYFNYTFRQRNNSPGGRWGNPPGTPTGVYQLQYTPGRLARIAEDWTITPTVLNHFAVGYNRFGNLNQSVFVDQDWPSKIGLQNVDKTHFPALIFQGQAHLGGGVGAGGRLGSTNGGGSYNGSSIVQDDVTIIRGAHSFKAGFELRKYYYNSKGRGNTSGTFNFNSIQTQLPGFADSTGHAFASFLLGAVASTNRNVVASFFGHRVSQPGFYFMDDWKATKKLTLNLGIRWEIIGPLYEVGSRMSNLDPSKPNPGAGGRPGALVFADELGVNTFQDRYWKQIDPRFGFAYAVNQKMVLRGGYSLSNTPPISNGFGFPGTLGYNGSISRTTANTPLRYPQDPVMYLQDRYPDFVGTLPNHSPTLANGLGTTLIRRDGARVPYTQNFSFGLQYQLPRSTALEVSYIGNKGTRLLSPGLDDLNQVPVSALALGDKLLDPLSANPSAAPLPYAGFNGTLAQALRPFPQFQGVGQGQWANFGTSRYDSLQILASRHFTRGLALLAAYTWSKAIDLVDNPGVDGAQSSQDVYNRRLERSVTAFNIPQFLKVSWVYELPIGPGKTLNIGGVKGKLLGGWTLTGIHNYRSGNPIGISTSGLRGDTIFSGTFRPDVIAGAPSVIYSGGPVAFNTGTPYLNPAAFAQVPRTANNVPLRLGTAPRYLPNVRAFHSFGEDFGIMKRFAFTENKNVELRADLANAFNRAGRGDPNGDVTSPLFGKFTSSQRGPRSVQLEARFNF